MHPSELIDQAEVCLNHSKRAGALLLLIDAMRAQQLMLDELRAEVKHADLPELNRMFGGSE